MIPIRKHQRVDLTGTFDAAAAVSDEDEDDRERSGDGDRDDGETVVPPGEMRIFSKPMDDKITLTVFFL